ncbi:hypothetical protein HYV88_02665 [Candidatus Woesearchaeota archaeon]|nr:hypothetical protein [Candidatus Woesearchaeota archaeon]
MAFKKIKKAFRKVAFYTVLTVGPIGTGTGVTCLLDSNRDPIEQREGFVSEGSYIRPYVPTKQEFRIEDSTSVDLEQSSSQNYHINQRSDLFNFSGPYQSSKREDITIPVLSEEKTSSDKDQINIEAFFKTPQGKLLDSLNNLK